jgi:succinyl-CoA synthetase alpha subunit
MVGGIHPKKGGLDLGRLGRETADLCLPLPRQGCDRRQRIGDLRAAGRRRGSDHRSHRGEIPLIVCITEGIPVQDMVKVKASWTSPSRG